MSEEPKKSQPQDLGAQALEIARRRQDAASQVLALIHKHFESNGASPETVLFAAAWLAGTSLYRSLGIGAELEPGVVVLSEKANEEGPTLLAMFAYLLPRFGIKFNMAEAVFDVPQEHESQVDLLTIQQALQAPYNEIMRSHGFDYAEGARTGAVVCALLVKAYCGRTQQLDPRLAAGIVSMGFIEGSKTAPAPLAS
ncbi:MAG TPA: hypothetical protein VFH29_06290 [Anaerolineales bacterium]|nr:hypothetical protein [Anaerolineales bacterium]